MTDNPSPSSSPPSPTKTAIVTGASSGIGLALTEHLLSSNYRVILADISPPPSTVLSAQVDRAHYHRTDVSSWRDTAAVFRLAYKLSGGKIDFFAANAGIDDRESVYVDDSEEDDDENGEKGGRGPREPNLTTLDVDLKSVFYGLKCFVHYARRTRRRLDAEKSPTGAEGQAADSDFRPQLIATASCVALYRFPTNPQYCAAKTGIVGLVRSVAERLFLHDEARVAVNAILPAFVPTNLAPKEVIEKWPAEHVTPMSTVLRAYEELMDVRKERRGECVECVLGELYWREQVGYSCWSQEWMVEDLAGFWGRGYAEGGGGGSDGRKRKREGDEKDNGVEENIQEGRRWENKRVSLEGVVNGVNRP